MFQRDTDKCKNASWEQWNTLRNLNNTIGYNSSRQESHFQLQISVFCSPLHRITPHSKLLRYPFYRTIHLYLNKISHFIITKIVECIFTIRPILAPHGVLHSIIFIHLQFNSFNILQYTQNRFFSPYMFLATLNPVTLARSYTYHSTKL